MNKTLFIGDINIDILMYGLSSMPLPDREITCAGFETVPGSSAFIAAHAFSSLGGKAGFAGLAGTDDNGVLMINAMKNAGISSELVERTDKVKTGVTVNLIQENIRSQVTYPGTISEYSGSMLTPDALSSYTHIHFAGPYQQLKFKGKISSLLALAKDAGITTSIDTQWDATEKWEFLDDWLRKVDYLFVNSDEAVSITGCPGAEEACEKLALLTACPVVKLGRAGAIAISGSRAVKAFPYKVEVKDTTGAGDNFDAGFLFAILEKKLSFNEALHFGNAAGARSCQFPGGTAAKSSYRDIIDFMEAAK